ncbi:MAG: protein kinase [Candidatus Acidiferrales bacterium]|jgi:serine/threonine-protein kinase
MPLSAGTKLGSYEILSAIGAGGMGEVYQAHDTKLGRDVAIKVLPEAFAHDLDRLSRFQREAKILASLNHPNIAAIYGLEENVGTSYLVMELVPGETLAERIKRGGAIPEDETLTIARQMAEALEAAHEKGIIHRDLKPANVKVTPEGKVKVLDFGLAKAFADDSASQDIANSPTMSGAATMQGVILGTAAYMSPEQARGKAVDKRTDIWAFGCVLYELLSGRQAFHGEDTTDILAAVVRAEPDWSKLPGSLPANIGLLLRRCLQKDKTQRLRDAGDARIEIQETLLAPTAAKSATSTASWLAVGWRQFLVLGLVAMAILAIGGIAVWNLKPGAPRPVTRLVINLPPGDRLAALDYPAVTISPDGTLLAYVAIHAGTRQIFLRALDSLEAKPLAGTDGANTPFFSPDGQWLGFFAAGKLKKVSVSGGTVSTLGDAPVPRGATWGGDGTIVFAPTNSSFLEQISEAGGAPQALPDPEKRETADRWPEFLPNSKAVLLAAAGRIVAQSLSSGERRELIPSGSWPHYATSGHLIYAQGGNLMAAPFDPRRLQITSAAVPVAEGIFQGGPIATVALSSTGSLVYVPGGSVAAERLVWVNRNGTEQELAAPPHAYRFPRISPDGRRVAVSVAEQGNEQIWLYDFVRETLTRLTFSGSLNQVPAWTPDGKRIAFDSNKEGGPTNIFWQPADGSSGAERLDTSEYAHVPTSFSPNGQLLAYVELNPTTGRDIWVLRLSDRKAQPFLRTQFNESVPAFSPDGHWLAYISDESGKFEVYAQPYPGPGGKYQISVDGGSEPVWNPNGKEMFYRSDDKMMAVDITTQPSFSVGKPKMLFQGSYLPTAFTVPYYDVSPDGQRFLMIKPDEKNTSLTQIVVVQNWFEELKQKVPAAKK